MLLLLIVAAFGSPQDPPKVTYEDSGEFRLLALDLEQRFKGRLKFADRIPKKEISISVRDAGYFQALDALCRAHKKVTYFPMDEVDGALDRLMLYPEPWVEHPASYEGHFKTALVSMSRTLRSRPSGDSSDVEVEVVLFAPPWIPMLRFTGTFVTWVVEEAVAADGRDVRLKDDESARGRLTHANHAVSLLKLRDFDLAKGLRTFSGTAELMYSESKTVRLAVEKKAEARIPQGRLVIDSVSEEEGDWRIAVRFEPTDRSAPPLNQLLEARAYYEGGPAGGTFLRPQSDFSRGGRSVEVRVSGMAWAPGWIEFNALTERREVRIPFRFNDLVLRKE